MAAAPGTAPSQGPTPDELPAMDENCIKVICLGDSAVGKSKYEHDALFWQTLIDEDGCRLVERFLMDDYQPHQLSTYALTLFRHATQVAGKQVTVGKPEVHTAEGF